MQIQAWQIKTLYAVARSLGIDNEELHTLVEGLTNKASIKALDSTQADVVIKELKVRQKAAGIALPPQKQASRKSVRPGGVTAEQQGKIWALIGELEKWDIEPSKATYRERVCGVIKKELGMDASPSNPFQWLTMKQAIQLIDALKRYAANAELKAARNRQVSHG